MRSILEQAIVHQLNGEADKAQELFHQFVVARARQIHESMRNGEDPLVEGFDDNVDADTYFTEDDLATLSDGEEDVTDSVGDEDGLDGDAEGEDFGGDDMGEDEATADLGDDLGDDMDMDDGAAESTDEKLDELTAKLNELIAAFDEANGNDAGGDDDMDDGFGGEPADAGDEFADDDFDGGEEGEDEFDKIGESVTSELDKVAVTMVDGKEIAAGGTFAQQRKSTLPQKKIGERQGGEPVVIKSSTHTGFDREAAPSVADMKKRRNTMKKSTEGRSGVSGGAEKGEGKELGGKTVAKNTKSPLSGLSKS